MSFTAIEQPSYVLGHSERELDRLSRQATAFEPFTRQLLLEAGIKPGMRVLDVGCGSGDVALLVAEMIGRLGMVVGVDRADAAVERAQSRAKTRGLSNVHFVTGDPVELGFEYRFDAVVGRLVLMYYPDAVTAVRKLSRLVKPGGLVVFQELDEENCRSFPPAPTFECATSWIKQALKLSGARPQTGLQLYSIFLSAGLPAPWLRMDARVGTGSDPTVDLMAEVVESLLPAIQRFGVASAEEVEIGSLGRRLHEEIVALQATVLSPALIGAWTRT